MRMISATIDCSLASFPVLEVEGGHQPRAFEIPLPPPLLLLLDL